MEAVIKIPSEFERNDIEKKIKKYPLEGEYLYSCCDHHLYKLSSEKKENDEYFYFGGRDEPKIQRLIRESLGD